MDVEVEQTGGLKKRGTDREHAPSRHLVRTEQENRAREEFFICFWLILFWFMMMKLKCNF